MNACFMTQSTSFMRSITTRNPFPYTAKFMFLGVRNNETQQIRR